MMAILMWPIWSVYKYYIDTNVIILSLLPFNRARTRAIFRIGPHHKEVLSIIICGILGDWWADEIKSSNNIPSVRFNIEQSVNNSAYIHSISLILFNHGYCSSQIPKLVKKSEGINDKRKNKTEIRFNYRLTLFTFTSLHWIYESFYTKVNGVTLKRVPDWIEEYITPLGLAHFIMQDGSRKMAQGVVLATNSFTKQECFFLSKILNRKFNLKSSVVKSGYENQWVINIHKRSMVTLASIVSPYIIPEMEYKLKGYI